MKQFILSMCIIFAIKVFDNVLSTSKMILVQKNKAILASLTVVNSQKDRYMPSKNGITKPMIKAHKVGKTNKGNQFLSAFSIFQRPLIILYSFSQPSINAELTSNQFSTV